MWPPRAARHQSRGSVHLAMPPPTSQVVAPDEVPLLCVRSDGSSAADGTCLAGPQPPPLLPRISPPEKRCGAALSAGYNRTYFEHFVGAAVVFAPRPYVEETAGALVVTLVRTRTSAISSSHPALSVTARSVRDN